MSMFNRGGRIVMALAAAVLALASAGCKNSSTSPTTTLASIVVSNLCGAAITIYTDGVQKTTMETGTAATLSGVPPGARLLEAKKSDDGFVVYSQTLTIAPSTINYVSIQGGASVRVTNQYGEILRIFGDQVLVGNIGDQITLTMSKIAFGSHTYQAKKLGDETVVAEFAVTVTDFSQSTWTITP